MKELTVINQNNQLLVDSRDVAEMIDKRHDHLLRDIKNYVDVLSTEPKIGVSEFFIESIYQDSTNRKLPCYLLTKKGCEFVANKLTGEKGVLFTAAYVSKFEEMENQIKNNYSNLSPQLQMFKQIFDSVVAQEQKVNQLENKIDVMQSNLLQEHKDDWRQYINKVLKNIGFKTGDYQKVRNDSYDELEKRARCNLSVRLDNLKARAINNNKSLTYIQKLNYLDILEDEPRLREIYLGIIREHAIKYEIEVK